MTETPAIRVENASKAFRIPTERLDSLKERAVRPFAHREFRVLEAVRDISFEVGRGEFFGIVGRNGSGKSTLLKLLASIYRVDAGRIQVAGRLVPFIELGVGFNLELSGRDNIRINATLLGLSKAELERRFDSIVEFAELERFVDQKLKNYSSGMQVRLAYSIAIQVDFDVLLLDEVLAVGDRAFQEKSFRTFERFREEGKTIVFVSHDLDAVMRSCDRALLVQTGRVSAVGATQEVIEQYAHPARPRAVRDADAS